MTSKLQPTFSALAVALLFVAASALLAEPLPAGRTHSSPATDAQEADASAPQDESDGVQQLARLKARVDLSMPYYSFGSMLPRRGS